MSQGGTGEETVTGASRAEPGAVGPAATAATGPSQEPGFDATLCGVHGPLDSLTFEELLTALELVTTRLANGDLGIEAAADLYEQAEILHAAAQGRLAAVEARIARLRGRPAS